MERNPNNLENISENITDNKVEESTEKENMWKKQEDTNWAEKLREQERKKRKRNNIILLVCGFVVVVGIGIYALFGGFHSHKYGEWYIVSEVTCLENGLQERICECGETETRDIYSKGHSFGQWLTVVPAGCIENGIDERTCECGFFEKREIQAIGYHSYGNWYTIKEGNCIEKYTEERRCNCGATERKEYDIDITAHSYREWVVDKEATKTEDGKRHKECTFCGDIVEEILYATGSEGLYFESVKDAEGYSYSVRGIGTCTDTDIVVPSFYNGVPVTSIGSSAFYCCSSLTSIVIPDSVTSIGGSAFYDCSSLTSIAIPNGVTIIQPYTFTSCDSLTSVEIPDTVTDIGYEAFMHCTSLISVVIPDSVEIIDSYAFYNCFSLTSVVIPDSVTSIERAAFRYCSALIEVCNKSSLNIVAGSSEHGYVGYYAKHIITDESQSALKTIDDYIFYDDCTDVYLVQYVGNDTTITLPEYDGGKEYEIWHHAFQWEESLTSITIPRFVTSIGDYAFSCCFSLSSIEIPASVTSIDYAFAQCYSLETIYYSGTKNQWKDLVRGSFCFEMLDTDDITIYCIDGTISK